jgi:hypothetical protein
MNSTASKLRAFVALKYPQWLESVSILDDEEIEISVPAPAGSQADHLVLFTNNEGLWIRFSPPFMCYGVESVREMGDIVDSILRDEVRFMVTMKGETWVETTLIKQGDSPKIEPGMTYKLVSWSGESD